MKARLPQNMQPQNMTQMLKQAQKAQEDMAALQEDLETRTYTAQAGGGAVEVTVNGKHKIEKLTVKPEIFEEGDAEMLEDFITLAVNGAVEQAERAAEEEMSAITGKFDLPGAV